MVRILFNEEVHFLKQRKAVEVKKSELIRLILKKSLDSQSK